MSKKIIGTKLILSALSSLLLIQILFVATPTFAQVSQSVFVPDWANRPAGNTNNLQQGSNNTPQKPILDTIAGSAKQCPYIGKGLYKPFSNISTDQAIFKAFNMDSSVAKGCIKVQGGVDQFILLLFKVFIGFCSVLAVIYIAVAGISMITEEANIQKKIKAKEMLWRALQGLLLSLVAWILLFTINKRLVDFSTDKVFQNTSFQKTIAEGLSKVSNFDVVAAGQTGAAYITPPTTTNTNGTGGMGGTGGTGGATGTGGMWTIDNGPGGVNPYAGTMLDLGSTYVTQATIFGYRDGNGRTGWDGDNGVGGQGLTHISGRSNYTGDTRSQGVAVPRSWITKDFGGYQGAINSAYAIFQNGVHKGNFPIIDQSTAKLDFTYGMVIANFQAVLQRNRADTDWVWNGTGISYKPLPGFWLSNPRPSNPMIEIKPIPGTRINPVTKQSEYGNWPVPEVLPLDIQNALQNNIINVIMQ